MNQGQNASKKKVIYCHDKSERLPFGVYECDTAARKVELVAFYRSIEDASQAHPEARIVELNNQIQAA